jgi:hypothetical protein
MDRNWGNSVTIVTGFGQKDRSSICGGDKNVSPRRCGWTGSEINPASYPVCSTALSPGREACHSPPPSDADVKNSCSPLSAPQCVIVACCMRCVFMVRFLNTRRTLPFVLHGLVQLQHSVGIATLPLSKGGSRIVWHRDMPTGLCEVSYCTPVRPRAEPSSSVAPVLLPSVKCVHPTRNLSFGQHGDRNQRHEDNEVIFSVYHTLL